MTSKKFLFSQLKKVIRSIKTQVDEIIFLIHNLHLRHYLQLDQSTVMLTKTIPSEYMPEFSNFGLMKLIKFLFATITIVNFNHDEGHGVLNQDLFASLLVSIDIGWFITHLKIIIKAAWKGPHLWNLSKRNMLDENTFKILDFST